MAFSLLKKNRCGFALVELMILAAAFALLAMVAVAHFKHSEPARWRGAMEFARSNTVQHAIRVYPVALAEK